MRKNIKIVLITLLIILITYFFIQLAYKSIKLGNNIGKSNYDLIEYILNISSYEAELELTVNSNKTTNKYILKQYYMSPNYSKQIVKEPKILENLEIIYNGNNLEIKNTNLGISKIYEKYEYLNTNLLWLNFFTQNYKEEYKLEENEEEIILIANIKEYGYLEKLYINKYKKLPSKIEIIDTNNQNKIYIEYKEIKLNNIQENNIFAFNFKSSKDEV